MNSAQKEQLNKAKGAIEALEHLKNALCIRELTRGGREYVNKMIKTYRDDIDSIKDVS